MLPSLEIAPVRSCNAALVARSNARKNKAASEQPSKTQMGFNTPAKTADALLESIRGATYGPS